MDPMESEIFARMANSMTYFHDHFKSTWQTLYTACENNRRPANMSIKQFFGMTSTFARQLEMHHQIEEFHIFPTLAQKMPAFARENDMLEHHKKIHQGLEELNEYTTSCQNGQQELRLTEMKVILDKFGDVLLQHLDEEVENLSAENMKRYWSIEEMRRMPM